MRKKQPQITESSKCCSLSHLHKAQGMESGWDGPNRSKSCNSTWQPAHSNTDWLLLNWAEAAPLPDKSTHSLAKFIFAVRAFLGMHC